MAIPDDLTPLRPWDMLLEDGTLGYFEDIAQRLGQTTDQVLRDQLDGVDVLAVADDGACVNVMRVGLDEVPTPADLSSEADALQMTDVVFGQIGTVFGRATKMRSTLDYAGLDIPGYVLWTRNSRGVFSIQVTAGSAKVVEALHGIVLRTLQPIPPVLR